MSLIVAKFGGTSVASAQNINLVKSIVYQKPERAVVVVSAPGKRNAEDVKITDSLLEIFSLRQAGKNFSALFNKIKERFTELAAELKVEINLESEFLEFEKEIKNGAGSDYIASRGEFFSAQIIAKFLGFSFLDAKDVIVFDAKNKINLPATEKAFKKMYKAGQRVVVPGFYGADKKGGIITFSRGGSDITGAILAVCANALVYENWTDVNGFRMADPRIVNSPKQIACLSYRELRELSYMGASVLHTDCVRFTALKDIPINIKNTFEPNNPGSLITSRHDERLKTRETEITGIAGQKGFSLIYIAKYNLNEMLGVFETVAKIFKKHGISIEHIPTNIDGLSTVFKCSDLNVVEKLKQEIKAALAPDKIIVQESIALVTLVFGFGNATRQLKTIFSTLDECGIDVIVTSKDSSSLSVTVGMKETEYEKAINCLYSAF